MMATGFLQLLTTYHQISFLLDLCTVVCALVALLVSKKEHPTCNSAFSQSENIFLEIVGTQPT